MYASFSIEAVIMPVTEFWTQAPSEAQIFTAGTLKVMKWELCTASTES